MEMKKVCLRSMLEGASEGIGMKMFMSAAAFMVVACLVPAMAGALPDSLPDEAVLEETEAVPMPADEDSLMVVNGQIIRLDTVDGRSTFSIKVGSVELSFSNKIKEPEAEKAEASKPTREQRQAWRKEFRREVQDLRPDYECRIPLMDLGVNFLHETVYPTDLYDASEAGFLDNMSLGRSIHVGINLVQGGLALDRRGILGISAACGLNCNNLVFDGPVNLVNNADGLLVPYEVTQPCSKSKITTFGLLVPVSLDLNLEDVHLSAGAYGGLNLQSYSKTKSPKVRNSLAGLDPWQYGYMVRVAYKDFGLYGYHPLNNVFKAGRGPETRMFGVGVSFGF